MTKKECNLHLDQTIAALEKMRSAMNDLPPDAAISFLEAAEEVNEILAKSVGVGMWTITGAGRADRERQVTQMLASSRLEGFEPDEADKLLLYAYIDDKASLADLLAHARQFATLAAYEEWQRTHVKSSIDDPKPNISPDQVMTEMLALIERKHQK